MLLSQAFCLQFIRFWGKILGTMKNYYVAEIEFGDGDYESEFDEDEELGSVLNNMVTTNGTNLHSAMKYDII